MTDWAFAPRGIIGTEFEHGAVAFFDLQGGMKLVLWPRKSIAQDTGIGPITKSPTDFTLGHNVSSREAGQEVGSIEIHVSLALPVMQNPAPGT